MSIYVDSILNCKQYYDKHSMYTYISEMQLQEKRINNLVYIKWLPRSLSNFVFTGWSAQKVRTNWCCFWSCQYCVHQLLGPTDGRVLLCKNAAPCPAQSLPRTKKKKKKVCLLLDKVFYVHSCWVIKDKKSVFFPLFCVCKLGIESRASYISICFPAAFSQVLYL